MKKNTIIAIVVAVVAVIVVVLAIIVTTSKMKKTEEYPKIVYIDNVSYYGTDKICDTVPKMMPEGTIETFTPQEIMPDMPFSANFGAEYGSLEYMHLEDGSLIVHVGNDWYFFESK